MVMDLISEMFLIGTITWNVWENYLENHMAFQKVRNPVPRVDHPEWLNSKVQKLNDKYQQQSIVSMFGPVKKQKSVRHERCSNIAPAPMDIEDIGGEHAHGISRSRLVRIVRSVNSRETAQEQPEDNPTDSTDRIPLDNDKGNFVLQSYQHGSPQCTSLSALVLQYQS
jgi:hypothetical protein